MEIAGDVTSDSEDHPETTSRTRPVESELPKAVLNDDLDTVKALYADSPSLQNGSNNEVLANALWLACKRNHLEIAQFLLENDVHPDVGGKYRDRRTALMISASEDIVRILMDYGADVNAYDESGMTALMSAKNTGVVEALMTAGAQIEQSDILGQTALMHAASRGQASLVRELLRRQVSIRQQDKLGRNVLHVICASQKVAAVCRQAHNTANGHAYLDVLAQILAMTDADVVDSADARGKTPLHLAVESNNSAFVKRLLKSKGNGAEADSNAKDPRQRTPLHVAASNNRYGIALTLLENGADANARADGGFTPLHVAAASEHNTSPVARLLLKHKANINAETEKGRSALHLASRSGNIEVVDLLLHEPLVNATRKDRFGETPLMSAATAGHTDIVALLSDHNSEELTPAQLAVSGEYSASIVDFTFDDRRKTPKSARSNFISIKTVAVRSLLTGDFHVRPQQASKAAKRAKSERQSFRWIHLPANNVVWCKDILLKWYVEGKSTDTDEFKRLQQSFNREHSGQEMHSHYMRPVCEAIASEIAPDVKLEADEDVVKIAAGHSRRRPVAHPSPPLAAKERAEDLAALRMMYLFMPYVHWDSLHYQGLRQRAVDTYKRATPAQKTLHSIVKPSTWLTQYGEDTDSSTEQSLILAHAGLVTQTLHIRRTLDQFLSPSSRTWPNPDQDQVIVRHQREIEIDEKGSSLLMESEIDEKDVNLLMVDQLWIWVVSDDLIITSFPQQWQDGSRTIHSYGIFANIIADLENSTTESRRVSDVYDLAVTITRHCFATYETPAFGELSYLDIFEITVQKVMEGEKKISAAFNLASKEASNWLKNPGSPKPESVRQNLLDIVTGSQGLLQEIRDVRDELDTLRTLFGQQKNVLDSMGQHILNNLSRSRHPIVYRQKMEASVRDQDLRASNLLADIQYLDEQANRISQSIKDLLDLKESFVSALQVADTSNQNQALMVFTIVTVIFSPLSFLTSFFALNVKEFPHDAQGNTEYPLGYVKKYVIGVGLAFALPCVIYALTLNRLSYLGRKWAESIWRFSQHPIEIFKTRDSKKTTEENSLEAGPVEKPDWRYPRPAHESTSSINSLATPITSVGAAVATNVQSENAVQAVHGKYPSRPARLVHRNRPPRTYSSLGMMRPNRTQMETEMKERSQRTHTSEK